MTAFDRFKVDLRLGKSGDVELREIVVSEADARFDALRSVIGGHGRCVPAGVYTGLYRRGSLWMSDTPSEIRDHLGAILEARRRGGVVLMSGLGLGMAAAAMLAPRDPKTPAAHERKVERVVVVEIDADVIRLVGEQLEDRFGARIEIIEEDIWRWKPPSGSRYSVVWHDIWPNLCVDNLAEMGRLHRRFARRSDWQGSWGRLLLKLEQRRSR